MSASFRDSKSLGGVWRVIILRVYMRLQTLKYTAINQHGFLNFRTAQLHYTEYTTQRLQMRPTFVSGDRTNCDICGCFCIILHGHNTVFLFCKKKKNLAAQCKEMQLCVTKNYVVFISIQRTPLF